MEKWKVLWREQKWALLLLAAVNVWSILLFFWARQIDASPSYGLAAGTPARLVVDLILINAAGGALIAAGRYRRAQYAKNHSETDIYTGDDLVLHVTGLISDTLPRYVQPGMPDYLPNMIGASYERGNLEQLAVYLKTGWALPWKRMIPICWNASFPASGTPWKSTRVTSHAGAASCSRRAPRKSCCSPPGDGTTPWSMAITAL